MTEEKQIELVEFIQKAEPKFENAPIGMVFEKEQSYAIQAFRNNPYLEKVARGNPLSLLSAMSNVASVGLSLNPAKKQAYLVPRGGQICLDPSYMGLCDIATQSGNIEFVQAKVVRKNDQYTNTGVDSAPEHKYTAFGDRGEIVGVYCVAKTSKGDYLTTEMDIEKINAIKDRSESAKRGSGPWITDFEEMAKKSVIRNAFKTWPKTDTMDRLEMAIDLSNQNEGFEQILNNPEIRDYTEEQKNHFDYLIEQNDRIGLHVFMCSLEEGVQIALYNSFKKGSITKYKKLVSEMQQAGANQIADIEVVIGEAMSSGEDSSAIELVESLDDDAIQFMIGRMDDEFGQYVRSIQQSLAA